MNVSKIKLNNLVNNSEFDLIILIILILIMSGRRYIPSHDKSYSYIPSTSSYNSNEYYHHRNTNYFRRNEDYSYHKRKLIRASKK